jgi:nucleoside-diphosphate-sugar epimerase
MKALVTGGGGFLGGAICRMLRDRGDEVRSFSRSSYPVLEKLGVKQFGGDLFDGGAVRRAVSGTDVVFHAAAKAGIWGDTSDYVKANVTGTKNVLAACRKEGVSRLVFTSSPSVVFKGVDIEGGDESLPYPDTYEADYPATKAADGSELATVSLRPHLIWGPGDNHLIPRLIARRKSGHLRRFSGEAKRVDSVYIDNAARAHLLAADKLSPGSAISGKVYFISNGEPLPLWDLVDRILSTAGLAPVEKSVPPGLAYAAGSVLEGLYRFFGVRSEPRMTRFLARELSTAHWFDIGAARRDLGYTPEVSIAEGLRRLKSSLA